MEIQERLYAEIAEQTAQRITNGLAEWTAFLAFAGRLYKYPFDQQLMIYAQCPNAIACANVFSHQQDNSDYPVNGIIRDERLKNEAFRKFKTDEALKTALTSSVTTIANQGKWITASFGADSTAERMLYCGQSI